MMMKNAVNTHNSTNHSLIAKLMATENINVTFDHVSTAAFDLENRHLVLPIYEGLTDAVYSMMIAHEVSHALNTPADAWAEAAKGDRKRHSYLNIIEDARIEKLIKKRYPGVVRDFKDGYAELHARDFFGVSEVNIAELGIIDRINLHFKSYGALNVPFSAEEIEWVDRVAAAVTFEDVVKITEDLIGSIENPESLTTPEPETSDEPAEEGDPASNDSDGDSEKTTNETSDEPEDGSGSDSDDSDSEGSDSEGGESNGDAEETDEGNASAPSLGNDDDDADAEEDGGDTTTADDVDADDTDDAENANASSANINEPTEAPEPITQGNLEDNLKDSAKESRYGSLGTAFVEDPVLDELWKDFVMPATDFLATERGMIENQASYARRYNANSYHEHYQMMVPDENAVVGMFKKLSKENSKVISHMLKEFDLKKSAAEHKRSLTSKTGNIDMDKLYQYSINEDIFLRNETVPEGKNHGVVMYVDFSGSMAEGPNNARIRNTMMQIFNMAMFCSKAGIPYRVYGFTNSGNGHNWNLDNRDAAVDRLGHNNRHNENCIVTGGASGFRLVEIIDSRLKKADWLLAMGLIAGSAMMEGSCYSFVDTYLGGTPLNIALYIAPMVVRDFQNANRVDKTIFMLYTDGGAGDRFYSISNGRMYDSDSAEAYFDPKTKRLVNRADAHTFRSGFQAFLTERIGLMTGAKVMGYDIRGTGKNEAGKVAFDAYRITGTAGTMRYYSYEIQDSQFAKDYKENGFVHVTGAYGFDSFTFVAQTSGVENADIDSELRGKKKDAETASVRALEGAFIRANRKTNESRYLVKKLMEVIG